MHECESLTGEKVAGVEHGEGWESLCSGFIAQAAAVKAAASAGLVSFSPAGIAWN